MNVKVTETLIHLICGVGFLYQTIAEINSQFCSGETTSRGSKTFLNELDSFPVVFDFIVKPGFDVEKLNETGYKDELDYFFGRSKFNSSVFGWGGHGERGEVLGSVQGKLYNLIHKPNNQVIIRYILQSDLSRNSWGPGEIYPHFLQRWHLY